jgi:hypothetical protein
MRHSEGGQAAIMLTMSLVVTLGLLGLVVDVGWAYWRREACATAADAAVLAAAMSVSTNSSFTCGSGGVTCQSDTACPASPTSPPTTNVGAGCLYAKQNGFVNSGNQKVTMAANTSSSPVSGVAPSYWVSATVSEQIYQTFSAVLGVSAANVSAKAVAGVFGGAASGCFYVMEPTGIGINMSGGAISSNCGIWVNSTSTSAAINQSGGSITVTGGKNVTMMSGAKWNHSGGTISPTPVTGSAASDPFASMTDPSAGSCVDSGLSLSSGSATLRAGTHCGSVSMSGGTLTIAAGTHIFNNPYSVNISGGTVADDGAGGVTLHFDGGGINMSGATVTLHAPTTGTYKGMLIYYDRSDNSAVNLSGGGLSLTGAVYAKASALNISGGTYTNTTFVINNINQSGGGTVTVNGAANTNYTSSGGATVSLIQ